MGYYLLDFPNPSGPNFYETRREPVLALVVHITAGLEDQDLVGEDNSAEGVCRYAATTTRDVSWHQSSDSDSEIDLLPASYTAWHASDYNSCTAGHEISKLDDSWADEPAEWVTRTLRMAAVGPGGQTGMRAWAVRYGVPFRRATRAELDAARDLWRRTGEVRPVGFVAHADLDPDRRTDPGPDFPWARFLAMMANPNKEDSLSAEEVAAINTHTDRANAALYQLIARGQTGTGAGGKPIISGPHAYVSLSSLKAGQVAITGQLDPLSAVRLAIADLGDDEAAIRADLQAVEGRLMDRLAATHQPPPS